MSLPFEIWASPEPTVARTRASVYRDQLIETGHHVRFGDLDLLASLGVRASRYPVLWERTAPNDPEALDLSWARPRLERLRELGIEPVVTLLHHGSGPAHTSLVDPAFPELFARYAGAVARAFPWIERWTPINEPLTTARFATLYGHWYPNATSDAAFGAAIANEALAMQLAMAAIGKYAPHARFVLTEDLQSIAVRGEIRTPGLEAFAAHKRERRYLSIELVSGLVVPGHPMHAYLRERCGVAPSTLERVASQATVPDTVGWNYYPNSERVLSLDEAGRTVNEPARLYAPISPRPLLREAYRRLRLPFGISEVHINGDETQRVAWLRARRDDLLALHGENLPVRMLGAWAAFGLVDWDSLLVRHEDYREDGIFTFAAADGIPQETAVARELRAMTGRALALHA